ncbi:MAG: efflux RND transporter periplasmic adaptor subunit [Thermodesulfobacteriota bacterium]
MTKQGRDEKDHHRERKGTGLKKILPYLIGVIVLAGTGLLGYTQFFPKEGSAVKYKTAKVERGNLSIYVTANGTVNPVTTVLVGSQVSGTIQRLNADFNSIVKKGELIAQIDPAIFQAHVSQATAKVENAKASLLNAQADIASARSNMEASKANAVKARVALEDARRNLIRALELFSRNLISAGDRDASQTSHDSAAAQLEAALAQQNATDAQIESAKARVESARAQIKQAEAELELARVNLNHTRITAPVNGIVISRNVDVGQTVAASLQAPTLFTIAQDLTEMQVDTNVSEADIGRVSRGQETTFTVDAHPQMTFRGKVTEVRNAPTTIQNVVTYNVVIHVRNPELKLKPGMTANVSLLVAHKENVLKIPNAALRFRPDFAKRETAGGPQKKQAAVPAAGPSKGGPSPEQILERLTAELALTPEQQTGVSGILKEAQMQVRAAFKSGGPEEGKAKGKEMRLSSRMKIRSLLTEEQRKKYDQMSQRAESGEGPAPVFRVWTPVQGGKPVFVEIATGVSDGSFTEVVSGALTEGQEVITEAAGGGSRPATTQAPPSMRGFR